MCDFAHLFPSFHTRLFGEQTRVAPLRSLLSQSTHTPNRTTGPHSNRTALMRVHGTCSVQLRDVRCVGCVVTRSTRRCPLRRSQLDGRKTPSPSISNPSPRRPPSYWGLGFRELPYAWYCRHSFHALATPCPVLTYATAMPCPVLAYATAVPCPVPHTVCPMRLLCYVRGLTPCCVAASFLASAGVPLCTLHAPPFTALLPSFMTAVSLFLPSMPPCMLAMRILCLRSLHLCRTPPFMLVVRAFAAEYGCDVWRGGRGRPPHGY